MKYANPVIKGFYPDPSVCRVGERYYLVCSTMPYFPGVPLFESTDLVNWTQIGNCLTRPDQVDLTDARSFSGVFAPTIRHHEGRFYMVTTNAGTRENFYVWTDDIRGEWSPAIRVAQGGIDPSLFFENGKTYFMSNGTDDEGREGVTQCEIDIATGTKLGPSRSIWQGTGGRYLESPHLYRIGDYYYLMAAEGGTEYGHTVTYARGRTPWGPFESFPGNPVLTNRNKGGYILQGVGHGDLVQDQGGNWWMLHLAFRQTGRWMQFHHLGREVCLVPVTFGDDGWFTAGHEGTTLLEVDTARIPDSVVQQEKRHFTFDNTPWDIDWVHLRMPDSSRFRRGKGVLELRGSPATLGGSLSPVFIGLRQKDFNAKISCKVEHAGGESGISLFMDEEHHYDIAIVDAAEGSEIVVRLCIGDVAHVQARLSLGKRRSAVLTVDSTSLHYRFGAIVDSTRHELCTAQTRYLSSEVASGFTGAIIGLYAVNQGPGTEAWSRYSDFVCEYSVDAGNPS